MPQRDERNSGRITERRGEGPGHSSSKSDFQGPVASTIRLDFIYRNPVTAELSGCLQGQDIFGKGKPGRCPRSSGNVTQVAG